MCPDAQKRRALTGTAQPDGWAVPSTQTPYPILAASPGRGSKAAQHSRSIGRTAFVQEGLRQLSSVRAKRKPRAFACATTAAASAWLWKRA